MVWLLLGLLVLIGGASFYLKSRTQRQSKSSKQIVPASESQKRVAAIDLDQIQEDASHILDASQLSTQAAEAYNAAEGIGPNLRLDWVLEVRLPDDQNFTAKKLNRMWYDKRWQDLAIVLMLYGKVAKDAKLEYVDRKGEKEYESVQVEVEYYDHYEDREPSEDLQFFKTCKRVIEQRFLQFYKTVIITSNVSIEEAAQRALTLRKEQEGIDWAMLIQLKNLRETDGVKCWQTLTNLGLTWGDGDLFHWNTNSKVLDDFYFSVSTTTQPGYFLPEHVRQGIFNPLDLIFTLNVPRSPDPVGVFQAMHRAALYCEEKLGGELCNAFGEPLHLQHEQEVLQAVLKNIDAAGYLPGSYELLTQY